MKTFSPEREMNPFGIKRKCYGFAFVSCKYPYFHQCPLSCSFNKEITRLSGIHFKTNVLISKQVHVCLCVYKVEGNFLQVRDLSDGRSKGVPGTKADDTTNDVMTHILCYWGQEYLVDQGDHGSNVTSYGSDIISL